MPRKQACKPQATLKTWLLPSKEELCMREFKIFRSAGEPGIARLQLVWKNILKHHGVALHRGYIICIQAGMRMKDDGSIYATS